MAPNSSKKNVILNFLKIIFLKFRNEDTEFKDFSTFMRFFCTRIVQAVVQARMGKMQPTSCTPNPEQSNWFNLVIDEIGEVAAYLKSTIGKK